MGIKHSVHFLEKSKVIVVKSPFFFVTGRLGLSDEICTVFFRLVNVANTGSGRLCVVLGELTFN